MDKRLNFEFNPKLNIKFFVHRLSSNVHRRDEIELFTLMF